MHAVTVSEGNTKTLATYNPVQIIALAQNPGVHAKNHG